jgi:hypothetical protein
MILRLTHFRVRFFFQRRNFGRIACRRGTGCLGKLKSVNESIGRYGFSASLTSELGLVGAVQCSLLQQWMTADHHGGFTSSVWPDAKQQFHIPNNSCLPGQRRVDRAGLASLGQLWLAEEQRQEHPGLSSANKSQRKARVR